MLEFALAIGVVLLVAAFRGCRSAGVDESAPPCEALGAAVGTGVRVLALSALAAAVLVNWRPMIVLHASTDWLIARSADGTSRLRDPAVLELVRRLDDPAIDDASLTTIVTSLWQFQANSTLSIGPDEPLELSLSLSPPALPYATGVPLSGRECGRFEWRLVAASVDGMPLPSCGRTGTHVNVARWGGTSATQAIPVPPGSRRNGTASLRSEYAITFHTPAGNRVGPAVSKVCTDPLRFHGN